MAREKYTEARPESAPSIDAPAPLNTIPDGGVLVSV